MHLICVTCGQPRSVGRRECGECHRKSAAQRSRTRYHAGDGKNRTNYRHACPACGAIYITTHKDTYLCPACYLEARSARSTPTQYAYSTFAKGRLVWQHRVIAESVLGRRLCSHETVHHIDGDGTNNDHANLVVLLRSDHTRLHRYLGKQRVICEKSQHENPENCWNILIVPLTTAWLETAGANVIKLWELDNQQPNPYVP